MLTFSQWLDERASVPVKEACFTPRTCKRRPGTGGAADVRVAGQQRQHSKTAPRAGAEDPTRRLSTCWTAPPWPAMARSACRVAGGCGRREAAGRGATAVSAPLPDVNRAVEEQAFELDKYLPSSLASCSLPGVEPLVLVKHVIPGFWIRLSLNPEDRRGGRAYRPFPHHHRSLVPTGCLSASGPAHGAQVGLGRGVNLNPVPRNAKPPWRGAASRYVTELRTTAHVTYHADSACASRAPCCSRKPDRDPERQQPPHPLSQRRLDELEAILAAAVARRRERKRLEREGPRP